MIVTQNLAAYSQEVFANSQDYTYLKKDAKIVDARINNQSTNFYILTARSDKGEQDIYFRKSDLENILEELRVADFTSVIGKNVRIHYHNNIPSRVEFPTPPANRR